ncbi:type II secretion system F family protein [Aestuariivirga litoralis]|uniref:Type II secretion system F family protein n=1 Tax=Aestuariivirga litoralis TaxID=2650924 RepID=A0A2W2AY74_9HYPH|nr:type II secretion system F family protein [Aestuariivirga litoralis]PZF78712.1 type II secretion system F family protein [Aestuariivirga litoralis]
MLESVSALLRPELLVTLLFALAAFAAVLSVAAPMLQNDPLKARMQAVSVERERMRLQQRAKQGQGDSRLRQNTNSGAAATLVDLLRLRKVFEAEPSRELLRQAGFRSERHLIIYLATRVVAPLLVGLTTFVYVSAFLGDVFPPPMRLAAAATGVIVGNYVPLLFVRNFVAKRQASIRRAWPDALDLLLICVEAGMAIEPAMQRVSQEIGSISVPLAEELTLTVAELSYLQDRRKALENLGKRTGLPQVKSVVTSLIQSERYGTPMGAALRVLAQENRDMRMTEAERKAAALPPRLTVPMMLFFMPVIFVVILTPIIMKAMQYL